MWRLDICRDGKIYYKFMYQCIALVVTKTYREYQNFIVYQNIDTILVLKIGHAEIHHIRTILTVRYLLTPTLYAKRTV